MVANETTVPLRRRTGIISNYSKSTSCLQVATQTLSSLILKRTLAMAVATPSRALRRSTRTSIKHETPAPEPSVQPSPRKTATTSKAIKREASDSGDDLKERFATTSPHRSKVVKHEAGDKSAQLQKRKLDSYASFSARSPFPKFTHPSHQDCQIAYKILKGLHGDRKRPDKVVAPTKLAGCGNSPSVLDALVRTILSQNTSDKNSTRAKLSMDDVYGGSDKWESIVVGGREKLQKAIESGGLSVVKSKVIISILEQVHEKYKEYSLDHLFQASDEDAMRELLSFQGVGPKTASCVLLFCLQRDSFAVDTHVYRLAGLLGWRPASASREQTQAHLDATVPDELKYPLHILLISHGKRCDECKAGGKSASRCELRKAFRKEKGVPLDAVGTDEGDDVKLEDIKTEDIKTDDVKMDDVKTDDVKTDDVKMEDVKIQSIESKNGVKGKNGAKPERKSRKKT